MTQKLNTELEEYGVAQNEPVRSFQPSLELTDLLTEKVNPYGRNFQTRLAERVS
jgi:hypothetical protein